MTRATKVKRGIPEKMPTAPTDSSRKRGRSLRRTCGARKETKESKETQAYAIPWGHRARLELL